LSVVKCTFNAGPLLTRAVRSIVEWLTFREDLRFRWRHRSAFNRGLWLGAARRATGMTEGLA
jgi:hypothetical protein